MPSLVHRAIHLEQSLLVIRHVSVDDERTLSLNSFELTTPLSTHSTRVAVFIFFIFRAAHATMRLPRPSQNQPPPPITPHQPIRFRLLFTPNHLSPPATIRPPRVHLTNFKRFGSIFRQLLRSSDFLFVSSRGFISYLQERFPTRHPYHDPPW